MADTSIVALAGLGIVLGLRHGVDWDHIAAIADITSSPVATEETTRVNRADAVPATRTAVATASGAGVLNSATRDGLAAMPPAGTVGAGGTVVVEARRQRRREMRDSFFLATLYAVGHAAAVVTLGLLAIWVGALLPDWVDPIMGRVVGLTLVLLGLWIIYSLARYGRDFRLQSRWMLVFSLVRNAWERLKARLTGQPAAHTHDVARYGPRTAFGVGLLHGIGAETGSQALLLASAVGATTQASGSVLLFFFTIGLLLSNSLVAAFSAFGFVSASTKRTVYAIVGVFAAIFSLSVGFLFLIGQDTALPDLEGLLNRLFGEIGAGE